VNFGFSEDALLLQKTLRDFLASECPPERLRALWDTPSGRSPELWKALAQQGVTGLLVPETHAGMGLDESFLVLLLEEAGRAALAEPLVATAAAVPALLELGRRDLCERWLEPIAAGAAIVAVGHPVNAFVADAHVADLLLLAAGDELHAVPRADVELERQPANDPAQRIFSLRWSPSPTTRVAQGRQASELLVAALDRGALACAAQLLGACERLLDLAVAYAGQREQFGQPIGAFQAVKHQLANVKVALEYARPVVYRAAHSVAQRVAARSLHVSHAKLAAGEAAGLAAKTALQVHGAIGYTWEQHLHVWMRRAWSLELAWGSGRFHRARAAEAVLAPGAPIGPGATFEGGNPDA
jgi:alkylation response protein AidB-like acyl-CoA dehydrogenase